MGGTGQSLGTEEKGSLGGKGPPLRPPWSRLASKDGMYSERCLTRNMTAATPAAGMGAASLGERTPGHRAGHPAFSPLTGRLLARARETTEDDGKDSNLPGPFTPKAWPRRGRLTTSEYSALWGMDDSTRPGSWRRRMPSKTLNSWRIVGRFVCDV